MAIELRNLGLDVNQQARLGVYYSNQLVGEYFTDLLINNAVIVELKAARSLVPEHEAQLFLRGFNTPPLCGVIVLRHEPSDQKKS